MPRPTKPPWSGSWPEPPPEIERDLALLRAAGAQDEVLGGVDLDEVGVRRLEAGEALRDEVLDVVDELLHRVVGCVRRHGILLWGRGREDVSGSTASAAGGLGDGGAGPVAVRRWPMNSYRKAPTRPPTIGPTM